MRAWVIQQNQTIELNDVETPTPGPWEIRVRVEAAGLNRADLLQIKGLYPAPPGFDSRIPGLEYAGVVDAVGDKVQQYSVGDRVMGLVPGAAYAEYLVTHEREAIPVPDALDAIQAAAVPEDFLTAYRAMFIEGGLQPGQWALIRPCTSGVGLAAVQLTKALGSRSIGTSRSAERLEAAKAQGLDVALLDDGGPLSKQVKKASGDGAAVLLDMLGGTAFGDSLASLRTEGTLVLIGLMTGRKAEIDLGLALGRRLRLRAMTMRAQPPEERMRIAQAFSDRLAPLFDSGRLRPLVSHTFEFADATSAHQLMMQNGHLGKIVLQLP